MCGDGAAQRVGHRLMLYLIENMKPYSTGDELAIGGTIHDGRFPLSTHKKYLKGGRKSRRTSVQKFLTNGSDYFGFLTFTFPMTTGH